MDSPMPSEKILAAKQAQLDELISVMKDAKSAVLVQYQGITVEDDTKMRKTLREAGVNYHVYKNSLTGRAFDACGYSALKDQLNGMTALALGTDEVSAAKILKEYADKVETFQLKAGFVDGSALDAKGVEALAAIPNKEVLIGKLLGSIQSPIAKLAIALQAVIDKQNGGAEEAPAAE